MAGGGAQFAGGAEIRPREGCGKRHRQIRSSAQLVVWGTGDAPGLIYQNALEMAVSP